MAVDAKHPDYEDRQDEWQVQRDVARGEKAIKDAGEKYLPIPSGFTASGNEAGYYGNYKLRAEFPDIFQPTVAGMVGLIHRVEAQVDMPEAMSPLFEQCTKDGHTLEAFHREITRNILQTGRYTILVDAPAEGAADADALPFFAGYEAEKLINWTDERDLFVLDESAKVIDRKEFTWDDDRKFRVLRLTIEEGEVEGVPAGTYVQEIHEGEDTLAITDTIRPQARGGKPLTEVPVVVAGPRDLTLPPEEPPLGGVARASLVIYRLDADYKHQLYHSGQETAVFFGIPEESTPKVLGSGVVLGFGTGSDAKYLSPSCSGITAHRQAISDEREVAVAAGAKLFEQKAEAESGEALRIRAAAQTATLVTISMASGAALEKALRFVAEFMGLDPDLVTVKPNLKMADQQLSASEAMDLVRMWQAGAIAYETMYENFQRGGIASEERDAEEEKDLVDAEAPDLPPEPDLGAFPGAAGNGQGLAGAAGAGNTGGGTQ